MKLSLKLAPQEKLLGEISDDQLNFKSATFT